MAELASAAEAPARPLIRAMGFDQDTVQHALAQAGGNEQLAINLILNGEVRHAATASSSAASFVASAVNFSDPSFGFGTAFAPAEVASSSSDESSSSSGSLAPCRPTFSHSPITSPADPCHSPSSPTAISLRPRIFARKSCARSSSLRLQRGSSRGNRQASSGLGKNRRRPSFTCSRSFPRVCHCASCAAAWRPRAVDWPPLLPVCT